MYHRLLFPAVLTSFLSIGAIAQIKKTEPYFPPFGQWENRTPQSQGMDPAKLAAAVQYAQEKESKAPKDLREAHYQSAFGREPFGYPVGPMKTRSAANGLIIKDGYIVASWGDPTAVDLTFSVAKSFVSTVAGLAWDDGKIPDIRQNVYLSQAPVIPYQPIPMADRASELGKDNVIDLFAGTHNRKICWDDLLRQTSDWQGTLWGKPDWADRPSGEPATWQTRARKEPGSVYEYNDTRVNVLALALLNLWRRPLPQVFKERVMDPIGASDSWRWTGYENSWIVLDGQLVQSVSGGSHWGGGMFINAYDQARFGYLTLRNGNWKGGQIISKAWLDMARMPTKPEPTYGFMNFFLNTDKKFLPAAPASAFCHIGAGTNMIYVDQENDLVIVARWIENNAMDGLVKQVLESISK
jgi:CubicO group peptidase (beta-lactamase class C family)